MMLVLHTLLFTLFSTISLPALAAPEPSYGKGILALTTGFNAFNPNFAGNKSLDSLTCPSSCGGRWILFALVKTQRSSVLTHYCVVVAKGRLHLNAAVARILVAHQLEVHAVSQLTVAHKGGYIEPM
jgi:hypothetical protein